LSIERPTIADIEKMVDAGFPLQIETNGTVMPAIVHGLLKNGTVLQYAKNKENESIAKQAAFTVMFEGLCFCAINAARYNSHLFTAAIKPEHEGLLGFNFDGKQWRVSLYGVPGKPDVDLAAIAVKYGGGGHKQACGFKVDRLPWVESTRLEGHMATQLAAVLHAAGAPEFDSAGHAAEWAKQVKETMERMEWFERRRPWIHQLCGDRQYWGLAADGYPTIYGETLLEAIGAHLEAVK
jgi:hypothetical protein